METLRNPRCWWVRPLAFLLIGLSLAATTKVAFDLSRWRDAGAIARTAAADLARSELERIEAIVVIQRDARASIRLLREIERAGGAVGESARNALLSIDQERRR